MARPEGSKIKYLCTLSTFGETNIYVESLTRDDRTKINIHILNTLVFKGDLPSLGVSIFLILSTWISSCIYDEKVLDVLRNSAIRLFGKGRVMLRLKVIDPRENRG